MNKVLLFLFSAVLSVTAVYADAPVSIVYRGRIKHVTAEVVNGSETLRTVTFRLYEKSNSSAPLWSLSIPVLTGTNGSFQVELADGLASGVYPSEQRPLAELLQTGALRYIGVTVAPDTDEYYPRQEILYAMSAQTSATAVALDADGAVIDLALGGLSLTAGSARVTGRVTVNRTLSLTGRSSSLTLNAINLGSSSGTRFAASNHFSVFGSRRYLTSFNGCAENQVLWTASGSGFVLLLSEDREARCLTIPVNTGDSVFAPRRYSSGPKLYFYPFGTSN